MTELKGFVLPLPHQHPHRQWWIHKYYWSVLEIISWRFVYCRCTTSSIHSAKKPFARIIVDIQLTDNNMNWFSQNHHQITHHWTIIYIDTSIICNHKQPTNQPTPPLMHYYTLWTRWITVLKNRAESLDLVGVELLFGRATY